MQATDFVLTFALTILALGVPGGLRAEETAPEPSAPAVSVAPVAAPGTDAASQAAAVTAVAADTSVAAVVAAPTAAAVASTTAPEAGRSAGASEFTPADRLVVHKAKRRLELLKAGAVIAEYPIRLGLNPAGHKLHEGDFRTPEGHYYLSRRNPRSEYFLSIEVSYPNDADRRRARGNGQQPGGSIMIHGQPNVPRKPGEYYARNDWTDGCIAVSNSDMVDIWLRTKVGLPIDIRP
jgi:murein L,D-transpeptidase YafK